MPLKTLIVGAGSIGERHLRCFQQQPGVDVALCEPNDVRRIEVAERYNVRTAFNSLSAAAEREWDAAVVCTPAHLHIDHSLQLLANTPAILIEKPLTTPSIDADPLVHAVRDKTVAVAYTYRAHPAVLNVKHWIEEGELGNVYQLTVVTGSPFPKHRPAYASTYYARRETGGGAIQDAATHLFDLAHYLVGRFDWVFCDAAHQVLPSVDVEDTAHVIGRANGHQVMVSIAVNQFMAPYEVTMHVNGDLATARLDLHLQRYGLIRQTDSDWTWHDAPIRERDDLFLNQAALFLDAVAGNRPVTCTVAEAQHSFEINVAALKSVESGHIVRVNGTPALN